jgi:hypothetical protein
MRHCGKLSINARLGLPRTTLLLSIYSAKYNKISNKDFIIYRMLAYPESSLKNLTLYTWYLYQKGIMRVEVGLKNPISSL